MTKGMFADTSSFQMFTSMPAYASWSAQDDGVARLVLKATEGTGFEDGIFEQTLASAVASGVSIEGIYHYARPDLNGTDAAGAQREAVWFAQVLGQARLQQYPIMLDFEQQESLLWAHAWIDAVTQLAGGHLTIKPVLYSSLFTFNTLWGTDPTLAAKFDAAIADWYDPTLPPPTPPAGWVMRWWQFTDNQAPRPVVPVPGVSMPVDLNIWQAAPTGIEEGGGMFIAHPTIAGRFDLLYQGTDGNVWHNTVFSLAALQQPGIHAENWGRPAGVTLSQFPGSVAGCWSQDGQNLSVIAIDAAGKFWTYGRTVQGGVAFQWGAVPGLAQLVPVDDDSPGVPSTDTSLVTTTVQHADGTSESVSYHVSP